MPTICDAAVTDGAETTHIATIHGETVSDFQTGETIMKIANATIENAVPDYTAELATRAVHALASFERTFRAWRIRARTRSALRDLSPRLLDDVGIDRAAALEEAGKPFWEE
jgi:uncharacterized protein YjiS (DUF1127 family)